MFSIRGSLEQTGIGRGETSQKLEDVTGSMTFLNQTSLGFLNSLNGGDGSCLFPVRGGEEPATTIPIYRRLGIYVSLLHNEIYVVTLRVTHTKVKNPEKKKKFRKKKDKGKEKLTLLTISMILMT